MENNPEKIDLLNLLAPTPGQKERFKRWWKRQDAKFNTKKEN